MSLRNIPVGKDIATAVNVIIEISAGAQPVKYEVDKESGALFVDRFLCTAMYYPCNYGYIPGTLSEDGDPVDVLVVTPTPVMSGAIVTCRPVGLLQMTDEKGVDAKLLAVPSTGISKLYEHIKKPEDFPEPMLETIRHFFEHYKDLEKGKWVKVEGWLGADAAIKEIEQSIARYKD